MKIVPTCILQRFLPCTPCEVSELSHFRNQIEEKGIELIFKENIHINCDEGEDKDIYIDTTAEEKNITYPTGDKLAKKEIKKCLKKQ